jgi:glutamate dehydrogenase
MAVELSGSDDEAAARLVIEQAGAALCARRKEIPATFVAQLFAHAVPEDVVTYAAADLAYLAERAYDFLAERPSGAAKIRCDTLQLRASHPSKSTSVIEIANDDMPFLLDSVMGELAERRLDVRLVVHPVFGVRRQQGKLVAIGATSDADTMSESFIHIHIDAIESDAACAEIVEVLRRILADVRLAVQDWRPMLDHVNGII